MYMFMYSVHSTTAEHSIFNDVPCARGSYKERESTTKAPSRTRNKREFFDHSGRIVQATSCTTTCQTETSGRMALSEPVGLD